MLRFDPGAGRIAATRSFQVWEGGGEYNVARGLKRCFGLKTAIVTALADNPVGRLVEDLMYQGGVDQSHVLWVKYDGVGRAARNGLNFVERGFGVRAALGCSDRGHTAVSQLKPGQIDWDAVFGGDSATSGGARWFHTGGIFVALSDSTPLVAKEAMEAARRHGAMVSYDLNYRESLWRNHGGRARAIEVNRELAPLVDVMLGVDIEETPHGAGGIDMGVVRAAMRETAERHPNLKVVATTLRHARSATINDWGAICYMDEEFYEARAIPGLEILDRVGGGDSFAAGLIYGLMMERGPQWAVDCGCAHGALAMTTPGDASMATLAEVERVMRGGAAGVSR
jgi:2-dehydro-3-deoxygluconokinase